MEIRQEVREFLGTRRARITPQQAGLPFAGANRRVSGLRREEVALLAGVSVDYYVRLERGSLAGASDAVLESVARALQLDDAERAHLFDLARIASTRGGRSATARPGVRTEVQWLLDAMTGSPAYVRDHRMDVLAGNAMGRAVFAPVFAMQRPSMIRFTFLEPAATEFFVEWERVAADSAATLRMLAAEFPYDQGISAVVGELSTRSRLFARLWAEHNVRQHRAGTKRINHPVVGRLELRYESMALPAEPNLRLNGYVAEPGSETADRLALLASWAATSAASEASEASAGAAPQAAASPAPSAAP
ncbi:helix-turn-helix transcriptional regulator [Propionicimonas sp.]|uniref:helix-turn-helix transcriptional regulator n=1 Tax=Propionicimonas sp. TaxID=1955623 RepID=UPI0039E64776